MLDKRILPETFDFGVPAVDIIETGSKGLDKQAMVKRASAFGDVIDHLETKPNRTYLHVITTGAMEKYGANLNADAFNETAHEHTCPYPEKGVEKTIMLRGGLKQYHDTSYMSKEAGVYQEHKTKDTEPSGEIVAAHYNDDMHRGELIISVDTEKWAPRLQKKASGQDIYLSMGCRVPRDICCACHRMAKTASEHCDHFNKMRRQVLDDGTQIGVINDEPHFYDISGVDVPADRIAFVLRKVASGEMPKEAAVQAYRTLGARIPMLMTKSARILSKLAEMEKRIEGLIEGDGKRDPVFDDDDKAKRNFILRVENYPADEVIDGCHRKGILLSPEMLFKLIGKDLPDGDDGKKLLIECDDDSCGDCSAMMRELEDDDETRNAELLDGSFDSKLPVDLNLDRILEEFVPMFGMTNPVVGTRSITITISGRPVKSQKKEASLNGRAQTALRRTYARYLVAFAERNDDATCMNALMKTAGYGK